MRYRRSTRSRAPREPLYWERVCAGDWGFGVGPITTPIDCESATVRGGLVLAVGNQSPFGITADHQLTVRRILWPTHMGVRVSDTGSNDFETAIVVIKTSTALFSTFLGTSIQAILDNEDVLDVRTFRANNVSITGTSNIYHYQNADSDRRWEINVMRKLQTDEAICAFNFLMFTGGTVGSTVTCTFSTPVISVLLQRTMRKR